MNFLESRRQSVLIIAFLVLAVALIYGFFTSSHTQKADEDKYAGLMLQEEVEQDQVTYKYFEHRINVEEAALEAQQFAYGDDFDWDLYLMIGSDANMIGDMVKAREAYEALLALNPIHYTAWNSYANILMIMGDNDAADEAYYRAIEIVQTEENFRDYVYFLEHSYPEGEKDERIEEILNLAVTTMGQTRWAMVTLAQWYYDHGDCDRALSHLEIAIANEPDFESLQTDYDELKAACDAQ